MNKRHKSKNKMSVKNRRKIILINTTRIRKILSLYIKHQIKRHIRCLKGYQHLDTLYGKVKGGRSACSEIGGVMKKRRLDRWTENWNTTGT